MKVKTMGIDLAKSTFQLCGTDRRGKTLFNKKVKRERLLSFVESIDKESDFVVALEACGGAHHIARSILAKGYDTKIISAKFVKPFIKSNKNDANDAKAITEAVVRDDMRFVGVKTVEQQDIQSIHRVREGFIKRRTALANETRGLLLEYGFTIPQGVINLRKQLPLILEDEEGLLSLRFKKLLGDLYQELRECFDKVEKYDRELQDIYNSNQDCQRLGKIDGVGVITATAMVAAVGDPSVFRNGREFSAWLGLTPRQCSTGGKTKLLGISKRGDSYIRKNLIHGCRAVVNHAATKEDKKSKWINSKLPAKGLNKVSVAVANKTARVIWVILAKKEEYKRPTALKETR